MMLDTYFSTELTVINCILWIHVDKAVPRSKHETIPVFQSKSRSGNQIGFRYSYLYQGELGTIPVEYIKSWGIYWLHFREQEKVRKNII